MLREVINNYVPYNDAEQEDKTLILKAIDNFKDVLNRENTIAHFTSSAFVVNNNMSKVLMVYHNIYDNWSIPGGHCDGEMDFKRVAFKELEEETGIKNGNLLDDDIFSLDVLSVKQHVKRGKFISSHLHLSVIYLMSASEEDNLKVKEDENSDVRWIDIDKLLDCTKAEIHMQALYSKLIEKINNLQRQ